MDKDSKRKAKELFFEATKMPLEKRRAYLAKECAGNEALRAEVDSLLDSLNEAGDFLTEPPSSLRADALLRGPTEPAP